MAIPRGSQVELVARRRHNELSLDMDSVTAFGRRYVVDAPPDRFYGRQRPGVGENDRTAKYVGGGALLGTIVGAIAGAVRARPWERFRAAAAGAETYMHGREIRVPAGTLLTFRLEYPLHVGGRAMADRTGATQRLRPEATVPAPVAAGP